MSLEKHILLPDGRKLAYAEFGKPDGRPVMYFHGAPSSRMEPLLIGNEKWVQSGLRVIAPDRPGIGGSDFQPNRGFSDWPRDVLALADSLGLDRFPVLVTREAVHTWPSVRREFRNVLHQQSLSQAAGR